MLYEGITTAFGTYRGSPSSVGRVYGVFCFQNVYRVAVYVMTKEGATSVHHQMSCIARTLEHIVEIYVRTYARWSSLYEQRVTRNRF